MKDTRTIITAASVAVALLSATWAVYESKHDASGGGSQVQGRPQGGAPGAPGGSAPVSVVTALAQRRQIEVGIEAIGTAVANESVNVTTKTSNIVTAIHFSDGQEVRAGQILVELDRAQAAGELAALMPLRRARASQPQPRSAGDAGVQACPSSWKRR
jgi:multidrug efflux pump subunit AcrA (membrane-fusion protein)